MHGNAILVLPSSIVSNIALGPLFRIFVATKAAQQCTAQSTQTREYGITDYGSSACAQEGIAIATSAGPSAITRVAARAAMASVTGLSGARS